MKNLFKRIIATILVVLICLTSAPLQFDLGAKANATDSTTLHNAAIDAYIDFFETNDFSDNALFYCADISGDEIPELILDLCNGIVDIYTYKASSNSISKIYNQKSKDKGDSMRVYVNAILDRVLVPIAGTGRVIHHLYSFSGDNYTIIETLEYQRSPSYKFHINNVSTNVSAYIAELNSIKDSSAAVNYSVASYNSILTALKKSESDITVFDAYISFLNTANINSDALFECADINGDDIPELILDCRTYDVKIYSYDTSSKKVCQIYSAVKGKGGAMDVYINPELNKVLLPSANTGGATYTLCTFSGGKYTINKKIESINSKHSASGKAEFYVNGILKDNAAFDSNLAAMKKECHLIVNYPIASYRSLLTAMKSDKLGRTSKIISVQSTSAIKLVWANVEDAAGYAVYQKIGGKWTRLGNRTVNNATISKLQAGTTYEFAIKAAARVDGKVIWSGTYTTIKAQTLAAKPANVTAAQNTSAIKLSWEKCSGADGYRIYYKSGNSWKVAVNATATTSHTFTGLKAGARFTFAIRPYAITESGVVWSAYTEFETATKPAAPTKITTKMARDYVTLSWNKVPGATHYRVYLMVGSLDWASLGYTTEPTKKIENLDDGKFHTIAIRSYIKTSSGLIAGEYAKIGGITTANLICRYCDWTGFTTGVGVGGIICPECGNRVV